MTKPVAEILAQTLDNHGVDCIYCVPGESFLPLTNAPVSYTHLRAHET